jgi:hypothetical protein
MATAAREVRRMKPQRRQKVKLIVVHGGKELTTDQGDALLLGIGAKMDAKRLQRRLERIDRRHEGFPERRSVAVAMLAVEEQIVKALWTIARQPLGRVAPIASGRCGIDYVHDRGDVHSIYSDAAGGKWDTIAPRPSLPSAKDITIADKVQQWLLFITDESLRKLLVVGATSKRGDAGRQISWRRICKGMNELDGVSLTRLNARYQEALRIIVNELTVARARNLGYLGG